MTRGGGGGGGGWMPCYVYMYVCLFVYANDEIMENNSPYVYIKYVQPEMVSFVSMYLL